jgi:hypothetical protein
MGWETLLQGVNMGLNNFNAGQQSQLDEAQRQREEAARKLQLALAQNADARAAEAADREKASWSPGTPDIMTNLPPEPTMGPPSQDQMPTSTETITQKGTPAGINFQKAQSDMALQKAQADALSGKKPLDINQTFHTYDEDIPMNKYDDTGKVVPRSKVEIDADVSRAYYRYLAAQEAGRAPKEKPEITVEKALVFDPKTGKAIYANGQLLGPTLDDAAAKAAAGYNWATLKADVNSGKLKGADYDKVLNNMARTVLAAIKVTDPSRRDEYTAAIKTYLDDTLNKPADQPTAAPAAKKPGMGEALAAANPSTPSGIVTDSDEPGIWRLAQALKALGTTNATEQATINDIIQKVEQPGLVDAAPYLMNQLKKIMKRNNYTGPTQ